MRKMTPMILVILMLASVLSSIDVYELQEQNEFEETSARAGADPEVVYVTSPRETLYAAGGGVTNQLLAGDPVNFKAYLRNSGDADLTNMQYQVTVYIDEQGERGDIAQDLNGNDLAWSNDKAVCSNQCQNSVLAPGEFIDGGESTLVTTSGAVIEWMPTAGNYHVEVTVTSIVLGDPGNDEISYRVSVKDYYDIDLDLTWLDENGNDVAGATDGVDDVDFKITVSLEGSMGGMTIRNTTVLVTTSAGSLGGISSVMLGDDQTVPISEDDQANTVDEARMIIGADSANPGTSITGEETITLTPPTDGEYTVTVTLKSYTLYEPNENCQSPTTVCERTVQGGDAEDEFSGNNFASIYGSALTLHDIILSDFYLSTVDESTGDEKGDGEESELSDSYGFVGGVISETLSTGSFDMVAAISHASSSSTPMYEWNVTFTVTNLDDSTTVVYEATNCSIAQYDDHIYLGVSTDKTDADIAAYACATHDFEAGNYVVEAKANMLGQYDEAQDFVDDKIVDMVTINNEWDFTIEVDNFAPVIVSLKPDTDGITGGLATIVAEAFDVEGDKIVYSWFDGAGTALTCADTAEATDGTCEITLDESMMPMFEIRVEASDSYNTVDSSIMIDVVTVKTFTASGLADGFNSVYSATLRASGVDVTFADGPMDAVDIDSCANSPMPVGSVVVNPTTTYDSSVVVSQTIHVHFPNDLGVQYMWMEYGNTVISVASGAGTEVDASTSGYEYTFPSGADMIPIGTTFYLIAEDCDTPEPPAGSVTQLTANPSMGGDIVISYNYDALLSDETVRIEVTAADGTSPDITYDRVESDTRSITWASGTDGVTYTVTAQLCNIYSCGDSISATVTSDASVAAVTATSVTISESGENWVVSWTASSDDADVAGWYVCYNRGEFTANEMKVLIDAGACAMVMDGTEATIAKYTTVETTQVHFGIAPHDAVMNIAYGASTDSILYDRAQDTTNPDDGTTTTDSEASSGVPTWTWGVIGAVVVVAFIVGAFILSRGEGEGDDDKEWDY